MSGLAVIGCVAGLSSADESSGGEEVRPKPVVEQLLDIMKANGTISDEQYGQLLDQSREEQREAAASMQKLAEEQPAEKDKVKVTTGYKGLRVETEDGDFSFRVGGRLQADWAVFDEDVTPLGNGFEVRRARIKTQGTLFKDWQFKLEVNFNPGESVSLTDAFMSYQGLKPGGVPVIVTAGHLKVPFSQQSMTSSNFQVFQERALADAFIDNPQTGRRRLGGLLESYGAHWFAALGAFAEGVGSTGTSNEGWGIAGRAGFVPFAEERKVLSFNGGVYYRDLRPDAMLRFRARPESHVAGTRLIDTGAISDLDNLLLYNISVTGVLGSFHAQAEYTGASVTRRSSMSDLYFGGWYVQAGYFLTGESRNYDERFGKYRRIKPHKNLGRDGLGAFEVALRYSELDLQNGDVPGGKQRDVTVGLNWYANPSITFRFNYVYANPDPNSQVTLGGFDEHINIFEGRMQVVF